MDILLTRLKGDDYDDDDRDDGDTPRDGRTYLLEDLANPNEAQVELSRGKFAASIAPANSSDPVFGPAELRLKPRRATIVYAIGSLADGSFNLLVQTIKLEAERHPDGMTTKMITMTR